MNQQQQNHQFGMDGSQSHWELKCILVNFYWHQIFTLDSAVFKTHKKSLARMKTS